MIRRPSVISTRNARGIPSFSDWMDEAFGDFQCAMCDNVLSDWELSAHEARIIII